MSRLPALLLAPIVLAQGARLRRGVPHLPPAAPPAGGSRAAGALRLLVLGDSTAVGTGVEQMSDGLAGQIARRIEEPVAWRVLGESGLRADEVLTRHLDAALELPADRIVLLAGWNDALQLRSATAFGRDLHAIVAALDVANPTSRIVLVAPPRFGVFPVLPQPLRSALGAHVAGLSREAAAVARELHVSLVDGFDGVDVAADRFHPDAAGYARLADRVVAAFG
ncbi:MAG TPA: SGNH/GDSL hydrolase family protein [Pseudolysinimonas sp.]|nr:SGNH/GDSL hydrolase family protein [Pseudolysinimonas sp.]